MPLVITDASVLIGLEQVGRLSLLPSLFGEVVAPPAVADEFGSSYPWLRVEAIEDTEALHEAQALQLDRGEAEATALALTYPGATLLIDERRGRRYATFRGIRIVGTFGVVVLAKSAGLLPAVRPVLDALMAAGFRVSQAIYERSLAAAGESTT
jgi:predicted nucleic acid-binding protein